MIDPQAAPARYFVHLGQRISAGLWSNATRDTGRMISALFFSGKVFGDFTTER